MVNNLLNKPRKVTVLLIFASALILLPSFLLLMASSWNTDDYLIAELYQVNGFNGLSERIFTWSPRFFSEIILYLYYNAVPWLGKPFTGGMILIIWLFLISSIFIFVRNIINNNSLCLQDKIFFLDRTKTNNKAENIYLQLLSPLLITLIFLAYLLDSQRPSTMFYLVVVSAAYVSTLAGIIFNLNFFINQSNTQSIAIVDLLQLIIFGIITSSSWEMGAIYQVCFSGSLFLLLLLTTFSTQFNYLPFSGLNKFNRWKLLIANLIPFSLSLYVLFLLQSNRVGAVEANNIKSLLTGNFTASFSTAVVQFFREIFFLNNPAWESHIDVYSFTYSLIYKLGFLLLLIILLYQVKVKLNAIAINACFLSIVPLIITNFIITFSGYYQLGITSPVRQTSFKSALIGLTIVLIALIITSLLSSKQDKATNKINICLLLNSPITLLVNFGLTITLLVNLQLNHLKQDISNFQDLIISNNRNWQENLNSNESFAVYTEVPASYIYRMYLEYGLYPSCDKPDNGRAVTYINYFDKQKLYATPFKRQGMDVQLEIISEEIKSLENKIYFACSYTLGNVEKINKVTNTGQVIDVKIDETVEVLGWAINPDKSKAKRIIITVENDKNLLVNIPLGIPRPDVAEYFNNPNLVDSGWKTTFTASPEWDGQTIAFKVWTYNPDTKIANFSQEFILNFYSNSKLK
ncbi:conserved membrane hypothetical protein [Hyella patelloides LEGE 07179]|uniref:Uncharacterized protein n=1 Tax=Hyella patelloides LEGE 07179 TaxID=945734 RepID=A0A563VQJ2_9CYAN|nr:hypothetical protein [Hyella patelloides]VEP13664.1 conserved membrane hypothetical protein [Hyella patelloides LEGE 07179]